MAKEGERQGLSHISYTLFIVIKRLSTYFVSQQIPHFVKRKDDQLMLMAGLWDSVTYEISSEKDPNPGQPLYTYTIITTSSNKTISFLHDRMPVIFDNGSDAIRKWLDPNTMTWTKELQGLLKPYQGNTELVVYPVKKDVGKVGNDGSSLIVPLDSADNKTNIKNWFGGGGGKKVMKEKVKKEEDQDNEGRVKIKDELEHSDGNIKAEDMNTAPETKKEAEEDNTEHNAPLPPPSSSPPPPLLLESPGKLKREREETPPSTPQKEWKHPKLSRTPKKQHPNKRAVKSPEKATGNAKITSFFKK